MGLFTVIKRIFGFKTNGLNVSPGDRVLPCDDCKEDFVFDVGEQRFFQTKGFSDPKRCPECRKQIKSRMRKKKRGQSNGSNRGRSRRRMWSRDSSPYVDER